MSTQKILFRVEHLHMVRNQLPVISDISFSLCAGEILGIYGENASAKTTLLRLLSGQERADAGSFQIRGDTCQSYNARKAASLGIAAIFGDAQVYNNMSIPDNVFIGSFTQKRYPLLYSKAAAVQDMAELLKSYNIKLDVHRNVKYLTVSERQLLLVLRAVANHASVIMLDDMLDEMDEPGRQLFRNFLRQIASEGRAVLIASQNRYQLESLTDNILALSEGRLHGTHSEENSASDQISDIIYPKISIAKGKPIFQCINLCYEDVLRDISLTVHEGEIIGVIGAGNAGRSVLARTISGHLSPTLGITRVFDRQVKITSQRHARKYGISLITSEFPYNNLIPNMSLEDNMVLGNLGVVTYGRIPFFVSANRKSHVAQRLLSNLGFAGVSSKEKARTLSNGMQKKLVFGRSIISGSQLLLLDDPSSGVDISGRIQIYNLMNSLVMNRKGILLFTSDISEALGMCDRILVLKKGEIIDELLPEQTSEEELKELLYR